MGRMGNFSTSDMQKLQRQLNKLHSQGESDLFAEACAKELAARLLAEVVKRTPVGEYSGGEYQCKVRKGPTCSHISAEAEGKKVVRCAGGGLLKKLEKRVQIILLILLTLKNTLPMWNTAIGKSRVDMFLRWECN